MARVSLGVKLKEPEYSSLGLIILWQISGETKLYVDYSRDSVDHVNPQLNTAVSMVRPGIRDPANTVVAVAEQFDSQTVVLIGELVKPVKVIEITEKW